MGHSFRFLLLIAIVASVCGLNINRRNYEKKIKRDTVNRNYNFYIEKLKNDLDADDIRDRKIVVVSVAGPHQTGKTFLAKFFFRYLYERYKLNDTSNWLTEESDDSLDGLINWSQHHRTLGIEMFSNVFTHDYENGEKVAIVLLDTQGLFGSDIFDDSMIFGLSTLLSSVQCYNVMHNITEMDLQTLSYLTSNAKRVLPPSNQKPFQNLAFFIRDWPFFSLDNFNGLDEGSQYVAKVLNESETQTQQMKLSRQVLNSSFQHIDGFLLPPPQKNVSGHFIFDRNLTNTSKIFKSLLKLFVQTLLAPDRLVVKEINGKQVTAGDFIEYMQTYVNFFQENDFPKPDFETVPETKINTRVMGLDEERSNYMKKRATDAQLADVDLEFPDLFKIKTPSEIPDEFPTDTDKYTIHYFAAIFRGPPSTVQHEFPSDDEPYSASTNNEHVIITDVDASGFDVESSDPWHDNPSISPDERAIFYDLGEVEQAVDCETAINSIIAFYASATRHRIEMSLSYLSQSEVREVHELVKNQALNQFQSTISHDNIVECAEQYQFEKRIEDELDVFKERNEQKIAVYKFNVGLRERILEKFKKNLLQHLIESKPTPLTFREMYYAQRQWAEAEFEKHKIEDGKSSDYLLQELINEADEKYKCYKEGNIEEIWAQENCIAAESVVQSMLRTTSQVVRAIFYGEPFADLPYCDELVYSK